ncbi:ATP-binding protein, partial [Bacteriovoracaceae bacterium]|nr:ATP-binding protein [Bacteriovoracaceae bacterium]
LKANSDHPWNQKELLQDIHNIRKGLLDYEHILNSKLTFGNSEKEDRKLRLLDSIYSESKTVDSKSIESVTKFLNYMQQQYSDLHLQNLSSVLDSILSRLPQMAESLKKATPTVKIDSDENIQFGEYSSKLLSDVFTHCFANILDHGIESPEVRSAKGKSKEGNIFIQISKKDKIEIVFKDDGSGLNMDALYRKGIEKKFILPDANMSDQEIANIVFCSGVSTSTEITDISGRGIGMEIVRTFLRENHGDIQIYLVGERDEFNYQKFFFKIELDHYDS